jgi:transketolase N-terminal domain/subunit
MLDREKIEQIAKKVAAANLAGAGISAVQSEPFIDSKGHEALRITIVLTPESVASIDGKMTLNTLVQINSELQRAGEERFPLVEYATTAELEEGAGT